MPTARWFNAEVYQIFKEELTPILFKQFHKAEIEKMLLSYIYEATVILVTKPSENAIKKENFTDRFPL